MTNPIRQRRQSETSKILSNLANERHTINVSTNDAINRVLNEEFAQREQLAQARKSNQDSIDRINSEYITATQDVLDDATLQFLIEHSNIDAPTLTSIFAGWELAKSSKAKKLNEQRQADIQTLQSFNNINEQLSAAQTAVNEQRLKDTREQSEQRIRAGERAADVLTRSVVGDVTAEERAQESALDRNLQRELQNIRSRGRTGEDDRLRTLRQLQSGGTITDTTVINTTEPDGGQISSTTTNPLENSPAPTVTTPIPDTQVGSESAVNVESDSELTDQEILLLNYDRAILAEQDPNNVFSSPLSLGNNISQLSDEERELIQGVRQGPGAAAVIQDLNENQGFNIGVENNLLSESERSLFALNRSNSRGPDDPPVGLFSFTNTIRSVDDLSTEEQAVLQQFRDEGLLNDDLSRDEFDNLVEARAERDGEIIPLNTRRFEQLSDEDQLIVTEDRLDRLSSQVPLVTPELIPSVTNTSSSDEELLLSPEVISQIDILNQREDVDQIDPLQIQQQLQNDEIDISNLTIEEFNRLIEERGL